MVLGLTGDVNLRHFDVDGNPFKHIEEPLKSADCLFGDLEGCFYDATVGLDYKPGWFHVGPGKGRLIHDIGYRAVGVANNVTYGEAAIRATLGELDGLGIAHTGAGMNEREAAEPAIVTVGSRRIGFLAFTAIFWPIGHAAGPNTPGVSAIRVATAYQPHPRIVEMPGAPAIVRTITDPEDAQRVRRTVAALRTKVDFVVLSYHWGVSGSREVMDYQKELAHLSIDAGADVVIGHHPHMIQAIEVYKGRPVFYSLGNCVFGWEHMNHAWTGLIASLAIDDANRIQRVTGHFVHRAANAVDPVLVPPSQVTDETDHLKGESTAVAFEADHLVVNLASAAPSGHT